MDFLLKTLDFLENVMIVVAELDPGQSPKISEDLGDLRLMRQQIEKACGGDTSETGERQLHKQNVTNRTFWQQLKSTFIPPKDWNIIQWGLAYIYFTAAMVFSVKLILLLFGYGW